MPPEQALSSAAHFSHPSPTLLAHTTVAKRSLPVVVLSANSAAPAPHTKPSRNPACLSCLPDPSHDVLCSHQSRTTEPFSQPFTAPLHLSKLALLRLSTLAKRSFLLGLSPTPYAPHHVPTCSHQLPAHAFAAILHWCRFAPFDAIKNDAVVRAESLRYTSHEWFKVGFVVGYSVLACRCCCCCWSRACCWCFAPLAMACSCSSCCWHSTRRAASSICRDTSPPCSTLHRQRRASADRSSLQAPAGGRAEGNPWHQAGSAAETVQACRQKILPRLGWCPCSAPCSCVQMVLVVWYHAVRPDRHPQLGQRKPLLPTPHAWHCLALTTARSAAR